MNVRCGRSSLPFCHKQFVCPSTGHQNHFLIVILEQATTALQLYFFFLFLLDGGKSLFCMTVAKAASFTFWF